MNLRPVFKLIISMAAPLTVGAIAGYFTSKAIPGWYDLLKQPSFNPPNWLFAPVWTALYVLMGFSCFLIWRLPKSQVRDRALTVYFIQLALNFAWSFIFFYYKQMGLALAEILLLWSCIIMMILRFKTLNPAAAYLNIPYLFWVTFASLLNASYFFLNH